MKKTQIASAVAAGALLLSLVGCSAGEKEEFVTVDGNVKTGEETSTPHPQTVEEACAEIYDPLTQAFEVFLESGVQASDAKSGVGLVDEFAVSVSDATSGIFNKEVKDATGELHKVILEYGKVSKKFLVDGDTAQQSKFEEVGAEVQTSISNLSTLCDW